MKATHLLATISLLHAIPCGATSSELEILRQRCQEQEQTIQKLEGQLKKLEGNPVSQVKAIEEAPQSQSSHSGATYTIAPGDNVDKIARRAGCSVSALNQLNGLKNGAVIYPGQVLKLPGKSSTSSSPSSSPSSAASHQSASATKESARMHTIRQGETYSSIGRKYRIPVSTLVTLNPEVKATALRPGLKIRLSQPKSSTPTQNDTQVAQSEPKSAAPRVDQSTLSKAKASEPTPSPTPATESSIAKAASPDTKSAPAEKAVESPKAETSGKSSTRYRPVRIDEPMTYGEFATKHGTSADRLNDLNGLDLTQATVLAKGSELYVPAQP